MVALGLLTKVEGQFANSNLAQQHLCTESDQYLGDIIRHHHNLVQSWNHLAESVKTGKPVRESMTGKIEEMDRESFLMGRFNMGNIRGPKIASSLPLAGKTRLLDLGGGPGAYAIHFCKAQEGLNATIFDLPTTAPYAEKMIAKLGMTDRVSFVAGDFLEDEIPGSYDIAWASHVVHGEGPANAQKLVTRAAEVLEPGGALVAQEFILDDTEDGPVFPALFSLNMLLGTDGGKSYTRSELTSMFTNAGLVDVKIVDLPGPAGLVIGVK
jgi:SAM-dependent methyltransferase